MDGFRTLKSTLLLTALLSFPVPAPAAAEGARIGWHGETMPEGLVKGETEGEYIWPKDQSVMVYVSPGSFTMGTDDGSKDERPAHEVWLDGYYIDKYEVSWKQWLLPGFEYSTNPESRLLIPRAPDWGIEDDDPMLNVTWDDAKRYVEWAGKRLPTEAEWEKAARGTDQRQYPWGNEPPNFDLAMWKDHPVAKKRAGTVDCCAAGASPYGVFNMAGNVYEWVEDVYAKDYYQRSPKKNPVNLEEGRYRVLRGGAFVLEIEDLRSALRYRLLPSFDRAPYIGFRAALSAHESAP